MTNELLDDPVLQSLLAKILKLRAKEREHAAHLSAIRADLGAHFLKVKARHYELTGKKIGWLAYLESKVRYDRTTIDNFVLLHRLRQKVAKRFATFSATFDSSELYFLAKQSDRILEIFATAKTVFVPIATKDVEVVKLSVRQLKSAIAHLNGEKPKSRKERFDAIVTELTEAAKSKDADWKKLAGQVLPLFGVPPRRAPVSGNGAGAAKNREPHARTLVAETEAMVLRAELMRSLPGDLSGDAKADTLDAIERYRRAVIRWPADHRRP